MTSVYVKITLKNNHIYDLTIGSSIYISLLSTQYIYRFYVCAKYNQTIIIEFKKKDLYSISEEYISIYEYSSRYSTTELRKTYHPLIYDSSKNTYIDHYYVSDTNCTFVAYEINPSTSMISVNVYGYI